ncbi:MAG: bifunctional nuclease family protein [Thermodesulfobacteriota bacterium]
MNNETKWVTVREVFLETEQGKGNMVILKAEAEADQFFLMFVGDGEFAAIAKEKGFVDPKRPLTHDLYLSILDALRPEFLRVEIHEMREETYYARVVFRVNGAEHAVDSRPSDAVALALNRKIPILVNQNLFRRKLSQEEIKEYEGLVKSVKF